LGDGGGAAAITVGAGIGGRRRGVDAAATA
jgi:hypothetical protein